MHLLEGVTDARSICNINLAPLLHEGAMSVQYDWQRSSKLEIDIY